MRKSTPLITSVFLLVLGASQPVFAEGRPNCPPDNADKVSWAESDYSSRYSRKTHEWAEKFTRELGFPKEGLEFLLHIISKATDSVAIEENSACCPDFPDTEESSALSFAMRYYNIAIEKGQYKDAAEVAVDFGLGNAFSASPGAKACYEELRRGRQEGNPFYVTHLIYLIQKYNLKKEDVVAIGNEMLIDALEARNAVQAKTITGQLCMEKKDYLDLVQQAYETRDPEFKAELEKAFPFLGGD